MKIRYRVRKYVVSFIWKWSFSITSQYDYLGVPGEAGDALSVLSSLIAGRQACGLECKRYVNVSPRSFWLLVDSVLSLIQTSLHRNKLWGGENEGRAGGQEKEGRLYLTTSTHAPGNIDTSVSKHTQDCRIFVHIVDPEL